MSQEPSSRELLEAVKQQESGGRRYKADGKTLLEGPPTKYGTAKGEMQVLDMTNRDPGFGVRPAKDDSPDERARVGRDYLAAMKKRYGDTETGLIAYNWGPGNTDKWLKKGADPAKLPKETQNYVTKVMASLGGPDVSRETSAVAAAPKKAAPKPVAVAGTTTKKPAPVAAAPKAAPVTVASMDSRLSDLGPSYQAALALSFLADTDEKEDRDIDREPGVAEKYLAEMDAAPRPAALSEFIDVKIRSPFAEAQQPLGMAEGGEAVSTDEFIAQKSGEYSEDPQMMANKTKQPDGTNELWGPDVPVSRSAKELKAYTEAMNPAVKTFTGGLGMGTRGYIYADEPDIINLNTALSPGEREITTLHELEHSMDARGGDIYGRPNFAKMGGMDNNHRAYSLMGNRWDSIEDTVENMVENREKLEKFFGRPLDNSYFRKDSYDTLKKAGKTKAMFSEQLASLSALEQTTGKFLTQDPEMRDLFPNAKMMAVFDALTGPRQTRMDARDLPPHTPVPSYNYVQNPVMRGLTKAMTGENEYGTSYRPFPIKRAKGSPETGEVAYFQDPFGVPDSGPVTSDTLSKGKEFSAADALRALKETGTGVARNVKNIAKGTTETPYNLVGSVADIGNMVLTPFGLGSAEPTLGSAQLKRLATEAGIRPAPPTDPRDAGFYMMGELGSSVVNPASAVRSGVKAAEKAVTKGGKAAQRFAKDFQSYNQALGPAGVAYAVKPTKGGRFVGYETPSGQFVDSVDELIQSGELLPDPRPDLPIPKQSKQALNEWMQSKLARYIRSDMATENDQFVRATDQGKKLHLHENIDAVIAPMDVEHVRLMEGLPRKGFAKTELGQKVEAQVDSSIFPQNVGDMSRSELHPTVRYLQDEAPFTRVYQPGYNLADRMQFPKLMEGMEDMLSSKKDFKAYGEFSSPIPEEYHLTPEKLQGLSPVQASEKVALFNQWRDGERQIQAGKYLDKYGNVYKKYDNGRKWIAMDDLAEEPKQAELVQQAGCLGGWCTAEKNWAMTEGSGDKRLHLLFDEKATPRVQLTVTKSTPTTDDFLASEFYSSEDVTRFENKYGNLNYISREQIEATPEYQAWARTQDSSERITEIKGQFNRAELAKDPNSRKYLKEVQDFVKSKDWGTVANLDGINMVNLEETIAAHGNPNLVEIMKQLNKNSLYADKTEAKDIYNNALRMIGADPSAFRNNPFAAGGMVQGYAEGGIADLPKGFYEDDPTTLKPFLPTTTPTANNAGIATIVPGYGNPNAAAITAAAFDSMTPAQKVVHQKILKAINDARPMAFTIAEAIKNQFFPVTSTAGIGDGGDGPVGTVTVGPLGLAPGDGDAPGGVGNGGGSVGGNAGIGNGATASGVGTGIGSGASSGAGLANGGMIERQFTDNRRYM